MYTLGKAKQEIDLIAKHATEIAGHLIQMEGSVDAKLDHFKTEILSVIEKKFAELIRSIQGDADAGESSAVSDLGAKVSLLIQGPIGTGAQGSTDHNHDSDQEHHPRQEGDHRDHSEHREHQ